MNYDSRATYETHIPWTWQDGRLLALCLSLVGIFGAFLNCLVLIGVGGNARSEMLHWVVKISKLPD